MYEMKMKMKIYVLLARAVLHFGWLDIPTCALEMIERA
jgi:hypothetical protein